MAFPRFAGPVCFPTRVGCGGALLGVGAGVGCAICGRCCAPERIIFRICCMGSCCWPGMVGGVVPGVAPGTMAGAPPPCGTNGLGIVSIYGIGIKFGFTALKNDAISSKVDGVFAMREASACDVPSKMLM